MGFLLFISGATATCLAVALAVGSIYLCKVRRCNLYKPLQTGNCESHGDTVDGLWTDGYAMHCIRGGKIEWSNGDKTVLHVLGHGMFSTTLNEQDYQAQLIESGTQLSWSHGETWKRTENAKTTEIIAAEEEEPVPTCGRQGCGK